jgi:hypothetical protein
MRDLEAERRSKAALVGSPGCALVYTARAKSCGAHDFEATCVVALIGRLEM